ncbi:protein giant-lens isoform X2 [Leptopilina heterotoma]|uniref:protein giant-lens isoform X2 n=1 Tax=Leptopilina heterotoma TaxID=63436 RepID=UPI001CA9A717|nr:protein giant-lens isoform X2 [Leptopilina heterotoma]
MKGFVVFFMLAVFSLPRNECKTLGLQKTEYESSQKNRYYTLNEKKNLAEVEKFQDVDIEIDLLDSKHPKRQEHETNEEQEPLVIYQIGVGEDDLPECSSKNEICSKVDLYGAPWVERQCRCPGGRSCPSTANANDGHTLADRTRQYKLCEAVKRIPFCRYFKDVTWSLQPFGGPMNSTVQRVHCRCRPGGVPYLLKREAHLTPKGVYVPVYYFGCSPQSKMKCAKKEPCKLFTVRKRNKNEVAVEDVSVSPLCQCHKGFRCPKKHTDPGSISARSYAGMDIKTYSAYCVPTHH